VLMSNATAYMEIQRVIFICSNYLRDIISVEEQPNGFV
jgi:hypothetical protein